MSKIVDLETKLRSALDDLNNTREWYACRLERIKSYAKEKGIWADIACIFANGTLGIHEPPTYAQQMNILKYKKIMAEEERDTLRKLNKKLTEELLRLKNNVS